MSLPRSMVATLETFLLVTSIFWLFQFEVNRSAPVQDSIVCSAKLNFMQKWKK